MNAVRSRSCAITPASSVRLSRQGMNTIQVTIALVLAIAALALVLVRHHQIASTHT